jgi:hypothetical protein
VVGLLAATTGRHPQGKVGDDHVHGAVADHARPAEQHDPPAPVGLAHHVRCADHRLGLPGATDAETG